MMGTRCRRRFFERKRTGVYAIIYLSKLKDICVQQDGLANES